MTQYTPELIYGARFLREVGYSTQQASDFFEVDRRTLDTHIEKTKDPDAFKEKSKARTYRWRAENRERYLESVHRSNRKRSKDQVRRSARRQKIKRRGWKGLVTPKEDALIQDFYDLAQQLTELTGVRYEVDHIRPLSKGGDHAAFNLQVIPKAQNIAKTNKWDTPQIEYYMQTIFND